MGCVQLIIIVPIARNVVFHIFLDDSRVLIARAGLPAATVHESMFLKTLERAPITAPSPTVTPGPTNTSAAIQVLDPMTIGAVVNGIEGSV